MNISKFFVELLDEYTEACCNVEFEKECGNGEDFNKAQQKMANTRTNLINYVVQLEEKAGDTQNV